MLRAQAQTEAQLAAALARCDAEELRAGALQTQIQVLANHINSDWPID